MPRPRHDRLPAGRNRFAVLQLANRIPIGLLLSTMLTVPAPAANWPALRGPDGNGICEEKNLPLRWSTNANVRWRVPLPDRGNSTPIIWGKRVFVTQSITTQSRRTLMCFDRRDGKIQWQQGPTWTEKDPTHEDNPPCTPSPVTDGRRVIAWFGSAGVYCYDFEGHELWRRDLGRQSHTLGYAASPALHGNLCFLNFGPGARSFVIALDKRTGKTVWQQDAPALGAGARWEDFGGESSPTNRPGALSVSEVAGSWATPLVVRARGRDELVVAFALRLRAFDARSGELLWTCAGPNIGAYSSPFFGDGIVGLNASGLHNVTMAVRPGGRGEVTATHRLWIRDPGMSQASLGAGVISHGHIYQMNTQGFAQCLELATGKIVWDERLTGTGARNASWSSLVLAGERLYVPNRNADVFVPRASPQFECLATNSIGGEVMNASLAVSDGDIFIRTHRQLWCISAAGKR